MPCIFFAFQTSGRGCEKWLDLFWGGTGRLPGSESDSLPIILSACACAAASFLLSDRTSVTNKHNSRPSLPSPDPSTHPLTSVRFIAESIAEQLALQSLPAPSLILILPTLLPPATTTMSDKEFTYSDVSEHASKKDLYLVIHDKVYNASSFVDEHPYVFIKPFFSLPYNNLT
jgi:hypothetical protein